MNTLLRRFLTVPLYLSWWIKAPRLGCLRNKQLSAIHLTRYYMYKRLKEVLAQLSVQGKVLSISGRGPIVSMIGQGVTQVVETEYPEVDISALPYEDNKFDAVVSDQVLEHVVNPFRAARETLRVVRSGGLIIHTTCFMNPIHRYPVDLWRFSPDGLSQLFAGAQVVECGGWGNRSALLLMFMDVGHHLVPEHPDHPLHKIALYNDQRFPIVTWIVARK